MRTAGRRRHEEVLVQDRDRRPMGQEQARVDAMAKTARLQIVVVVVRQFFFHLYRMDGLWNFSSVLSVVRLCKLLIAQS